MIMSTANTCVAVDFLRKLRPGGPWVLTAIIPDGTTITITARTADEVDAFIREHNGKRNLYYSVNPTRTAMSKKAAKIDIAAIEYLLADLDPREDESPEAAKARYLEQFENGFEPQPTVVVDSGNGIQAEWRLAEPISLLELQTVEGKKVLSPEASAIIEEVEGRAKALMDRLGSVAGTQNVDRILRLPGTTNIPNKKKIKAGRVICPARLIRFNGATYSLDAFPVPEASTERFKADDTNRAGTPDGGGHHARQRDEDELENLIRNGCGSRFDGDRSKAVWFVVNEKLRQGYLLEVIAKILLDHRNGISAHVYDQSKPREYAERQVAEARSKLEFATDKHGIPFPNQANIRIALLKFGVAVRYDQFADRTIIEGLSGYGPALDDAAVDRIWLRLEQQFRWRPTKDLLLTVLQDTARLNAFHPVRVYLDGLTWDGTKRIDRWLTTYCGTEESEYSCAVGALMLVAAVRRIRKPGCKYDEMIVLESDQGTNKSSALALMAVRDDWFTDDLPLSVEGKQVIEQLRGRWIIEAAELSGMRRTDIEHLKAFLSRQIDRGRMAYGRLVTEAPRQCVIFGTTNNEEYLRDTTGNRRFWPVRVKAFDLEALARDRDQLWAEAAAREATGANIRLDPKLWAKAAEEQARRLTNDPFFDTLQAELGKMVGKIAATSVWEILDVKPGQRSQDQNKRLGDAMRKLGWRRPNEAGLARIGGVPVSAYVKGEQPWVTISFKRDKDGLVFWSSDRDR
jgi:hypothetical protein